MDRQFVVSFVKRLIGLTYESYLKLDRKGIFGCDVVCGDDDYPYFVVSADGSRKVSCIDVACELFKWIKRSAETFADVEFTHAYVTKPVHFSENQVSAIYKAARKAGLIIEKMVSEPSSAVISWCFKENRKIFKSLIGNDNMLVVDFGGTSLDFSLVRYLGANRFKLVDSVGDRNLGGNDMDGALQEYVLDRMRRMGYDVNMNDKRSKRKLRMLKSCDEFKILLNSKLNDADSEEEFLQLNRNAVGDIDICYFGFDEQEIPLTTMEFYEAVNELLERCLILLARITGKPDHTIGTIRNVLLVGGSSLLKFLRLKLMSKGFTSNQFQDIDAMHCVSEGVFQLISSPSLIDINWKSLHIDGC